MRRLAIFRVDAFVWMGIGHLVRCLTLAEQLRKNGWSTIFLTASTAPAWIDRIVSEGNEIKLLQFRGAARNIYENWNWVEDAAACKQSLTSKATWLIVDHYGLNASWELEMRQSADRIMVIDDLINRPHECDILLDQNIRDEGCYRDRIPEHARTLLGPHYALLRSEFRQQRRRDFKKIERVNVFMGGTDPEGSILYVLAELFSLQMADLKFDVVVGSESPALPKVRDFLDGFPSAKLHVDTHRIADLFYSADLAIGAGGIAALERCVVGLPTLSISVAENQKEGLIRLQNNKATKLLGSFEDLRKNQLASCLRGLIGESALLQEMSECSMRLVDGHGARRVMQALS